MITFLIITNIITLIVFYYRRKITNEVINSIDLDLINQIEKYNMLFTDYWKLVDNVKNQSKVKTALIKFLDFYLEVLPNKNVNEINVIKLEHSDINKLIADELKKIHRYKDLIAKTKINEDFSNSQEVLKTIKTFKRNYFKS